MSITITHFVFDMGGVIVELSGTPIRAEWFAQPMSTEEVWQAWLTCSAPRAYETGNIGETEFAERVVSELGLSASAAEFSAHFLQLPVQPFPGVKELLSALRPNYGVSMLSNSNALHWDRVVDGMDLKPYFDALYSSHLIGCIKPDLDAFDYVINALQVPANAIMFYDDNQLNVDAARDAGMNAERVVGVDELRVALQPYL